VQRVRLSITVNNKPMSVAEAVSRAGMSRMHWYDIENGETGIKRETAPKIARALNVDEADVLQHAGFAPFVPSEDPQVKEKMAAFGRRLRQALSESNKSNKELAEYLGVSSAIVGEWISGNKSPMFAKIDEIARFVDCQVGWLYGDDNARGPGHDTVARAQSNQDPLIKLFLSEFEKINRRMDVLDPTSGGRLNRQLATSAL